MTPKRKKALTVWMAVGWAGFLFVPWYAIEDGLFSPEWLPFYPLDEELAPAPLQALCYGRPWLLVFLLPLSLPFFAMRRPRDATFASILIVSGLAGLALFVSQGLIFGPLGVTWPSVEALIGPTDARQFGMGWGALLTGAAFLFLLAEGLAARGLAGGDSFLSFALALVLASVAVFVVYPLGAVLLHAFETDEGSLSGRLFVSNLASSKLLRVSANSLLLAMLTGVGTTVLGLALALLANRSRFQKAKVLRQLSILPIITPPFVLGLALILAFGRAGAFTLFLERQFGIPASRYIFGLPGVLLAQLLSFTPVAFLTLSGILDGLSPSLEEAAQTLRASRFRTFKTVTLPLLRPGLATAFLLGFIESLADFGNPLVLGESDFAVLSTEIYFAVAGAESNLPRAAAMAFVLLLFTLFAFVAQRAWVGRRAYTTMTGKGDAGLPAPLPKSLEGLVVVVSLLWLVFTALIYGIVLFGGFVTTLGRDPTLTLAHYRDMFAMAAGWHGVLPTVSLTGGAWPSLLTTVGLATLSAPLTAVLGLLTGYLIQRTRFCGRTAFEFGTMLSFAVPGTVVGFAYVLAFNAPPLELVGTGVIILAAFVFRNMPVGIRAGIASLSQIDQSLDEASIMLGASRYETLRRVLLPLLRPAVLTAFAYGFARAMTAVSAVIFLVSADYNLSTLYILQRVESGEYGPAIAYSSVLIVFMLLVIAAFERVVRKRDLGRRLA